jgi:hypothetical protein
MQPSPLEPDREPLGQATCGNQGALHTGGRTVEPDLDLFFWWTLRAFSNYPCDAKIHCMFLKIRRIKVDPAGNISLASGLHSRDEWSC